MGFHTITVTNTDSTLQFVVESEFRRAPGVRKVEVYPLIGWRITLDEVDGSELVGQEGAGCDPECQVVRQIGMACIDEMVGLGIGGFVTEDTFNQVRGVHTRVTRGEVPGLYVGNTHVSEMTPHQREDLSFRLTTELGYDKVTIDKLMS